MISSKLLQMLLLTILLTTTVFPAGQYFVLCEGNFGQANASLWSIDAEFSAVTGPILWNASSNPLGDVGQSLTLYDHTLYIIMNNSHQIRMVDLESTPTHSGDIELPGASPRFLAIHRASDRGYVSCWNLGALLVIDLSQSTVIDTLWMNALPEEILIQGDEMYVSVPMHSDWSGNDEIWHYDLSAPEPTVTDLYHVVEGPGSMAISDDQLYVTSIYYNDAWESFTGTAVIDLSTHTVRQIDHGLYQNFSADIRMQAGIPYRTYGNFIMPLNADLSFNTAGGIGDLNGIYSFTIASEHVLVAVSDFMAPDQVDIFTPTGVSVASFNVGALPGDYVYYDPDLVALDEQAPRPQSFTLHQNWPNPFNPGTIIPFSLSDQGDLTLQIYDIQARLVLELAAGSFSAGTHSLYWDGRNTAGRQMASGIYHAVLSAQAERSIIKMTLLR